MTNHQAATLRTGTRVRRKGAAAAAHIVERVERIVHPTNSLKNDLVVHAGGHAFRPWEIERVDPQWGWPKVREAT
ncbi:MAG: hypothetical protein ACR2OO_10640 [Thermomicrobiales bacterium]